MINLNCFHFINLNSFNFIMQIFWSTLQVTIQRIDFLNSHSVIQHPLGQDCFSGTFSRIGRWLDNPSFILCYQPVNSLKCHYWVMEMQIQVSSTPWTSFFPHWLPNTLRRVTKPQDTQRLPLLFPGHFPDGTDCCSPLYWDSQSGSLSQQKGQWTNTKSSQTSTWTSTFWFIFHKKSQMTSIFSVPNS